MNKSEEIAEEFLKLVYNKNGTIFAPDISKELIAKSDHNVDSILREYGYFVGKSELNPEGYYKLNEKGYELARSGFFSGKENQIKEVIKSSKTARITSIISIILASIAIIISAIALLKGQELP